MDKEEIKELKLEYKKLKRSEYDKAYDKVGNFFLIASLAIFIIPTNLLSIYPSLKHFTQFMASLFPNISIYAQKSKWPEVTEFYFSYMWIVALIVMILIIATIPTANEKAKKYFGTGNYRGKGTLDHKYLMFIPHFLSFKYFLLITAGVLMFGYALYLNYIGELMYKEMLHINFEKSISTRLGMLFIAVIFQVGCILAIVVAIIGGIINTTHIQKLKKGE